MSIDTTGLTSHDISEGSETPGILGLFGSTIASMIALVHVDMLQLFSGPPEVFVVNMLRWCIQRLDTPPVVYIRTCDY